MTTSPPFEATIPRLLLANDTRNILLNLSSQLYNTNPTIPPIQETLETPHLFPSLSTIPHQVNNASIILGRDRRKNEGRNSETSNALDNSNTRGGSTKSLGTKRNTQGVARVPGAIVLIHFGRAFITQRPAYRASFETLSVSRLANE